MNIKPRYRLLLCFSIDYLFTSMHSFMVYHVYMLIASDLIRASKVYAMVPALISLQDLNSIS